MKRIFARHEAPNPFPRRMPNGGLVVDEQCYCGHLRSDHTDNGPAFGHGACTTCMKRNRTKAPCLRFTWKKMVIGEDVSPLRERGAK